MTWDGRTFPGTIVNISVTNGVMFFCVHFAGQFPYAEINEECLLQFEGNAEASHKHTTKAIRIGSGRLVLATISTRNLL